MATNNDIHGKEQNRRTHIWLRYPINLVLLALLIMLSLDIALQAGKMQAWLANDSVRTLEFWYCMVFLLVPGMVCWWAWNNFLRIYRNYKRRYHAAGERGSAEGDFLTEHISPLLKAPTRVMVSVLGSLMLAIWSIGWILYYLAIMSNSHLEHGLGEVMLYSAASALDMFSMDINSNVLDGCPISALRFLVVLTCISAVLSTVAMLVCLFLSRYFAYRHIRSLSRGVYDEVYVFFGVNRPSLILAQSIRSHYEANPEARYVIVFVEERQLQDDDTDGWSGIVQTFALRKSSVSEVPQDAHGALVTVHRPLSAIDDKDRDIWEQLGLDTSLGTLLRNNAAASHYYFFLSENRESNVLGTINLANNVAVALSSAPTKIFCQTRGGSLSRNLENSLPSRKGCVSTNVEVCVLDNSMLAVEEIKARPDCQPVRLVDIDTDACPGTVSSDFTALVVGFAETGQDMTRFLYEFGAFVDSRSPEGCTRRSRFECHTVDKEMDQIKGRFIAQTPGVDSETNVSDNGGKPLIHYHTCDCRSEEFYRDILIPLADKLNYVVVAIGDDEANMGLAIDILKQIHRLRTDLSKLRVCVRIYNTEAHTQLDEAASYYNALTGHETITLFGKPDNLFTYHLIVNDSKRRRARRYFCEYSKIADRMYGPVKTDAEYESIWEDRYAQAHGKPATREPKAGGNGKNVWDNMTEQLNKTRQDYSNVEHGKTKLYIIDQVLPGAVETLAQGMSSGEIARTGSGFDIHYSGLDAGSMEERLLDNLARLEHLRWNACQEMQGFVCSSVTDADGKPRKCYRRKMHPCLTRWENVDPATIPYDYIVTETTLTLHLNDK